jgi:general secretion pathway protein G
MMRITIGSRLIRRIQFAISDVKRNASKAPYQEDEAGFTLLELLVVIAILGLLIGLVAPVALRQLGGARVSIAEQSIERLVSILDIYKLDVGSFPTTDQGLQALIAKPTSVGRWNGPYVKGDAVPLDAWGHPYLYRHPSVRPKREYDLCSRGPNGDATENSPEFICNGS